jgi:hypothetical protein
MIRELLDKRTNEFDMLTNEIIGLFEDKLLKALRLFMKVDKHVKIESVAFYPNNRNFLSIAALPELKIGETISLPNGKSQLLTSDNIRSFVSLPMKLVVPLKLIEEGTPIEIYDKLKYLEEFIKEYSLDAFYTCLDSGVTDIHQLMYDRECFKLLDSQKEPIEDIIKDFDDLQKVQYMVFSMDRSEISH